MAKGKSKRGKGTGFVTNLGRSMKSMSKETAKDLMPNLSSAVKNNARFIKTTYKDTSAKFKETDLKESYLFKSGNDLIKNAKADIKSGNINNKERQQKNTEDPFAKLLNFDFDSEDDMSDMFSEKNDSPEDGLDLSDLSLDLDVETKNDIKSMANFTQANTKISNRGFAAMTTQLRSISSFQNQNTLKFYEMVEEKLNSLDGHLQVSSAYYKDIVENSKKTDKGPKKSSLESAFDMKGFNIEDYIDIYKENFKGMFEAGSMVSSMMIKPLITDLVNNPLGALGKMGMKSLIPKGIKNSLKGLDSMVGSLPIFLQGKVPDMKKRGGIWELFGNLLDLNKNKVKTKKNEFTKGPVPFDGITKRAITHVIPGYLKRILFALTGNEKDNVVYDMNTGKFISDRDAKSGYREKLDKSRRGAIDGNIDSLEKEYIKALKNKKMIKNEDDASNYLEDLRNSLSNISKSGKTLSNNLKGSDLSKDKKTAKILKDIIDGMDNKGFSETNNAMAQAFMAYQQELRSSSSEDLWSSVYDKGKFHAKKSRQPNAIFDKIEEMTSSNSKDSAFKKFVLDKIKNEKLKSGLSWIDKERSDGKNEAIEKFSESILSSFKGNIEFDEKDFKNNKKSKKPTGKADANNNAYLSIIQMLGVDVSTPAVKKVLKGISNGQDPSAFKATVNRLITGAKSGASFANNGLFQYMSNTPEGLALRVKIADGTTVPTTPSPLDPRKMEKNLKTEQKVKEKIEKSKKRNKVINLNDFKNNKNSNSNNDEAQSNQLLLASGGENLELVAQDDGSNPNNTNGPNNSNGKSTGKFKPNFNIVGELFNDLTGADLSKEGLKGLVLGGAKNKLDNHKYGDLITKYGGRFANKGKNFYDKNHKNLWEKFKKTSLGQGSKKLRDGGNKFKDFLADKGLGLGGGLFATGTELASFMGGKMGINKKSLTKAGTGLMNYTGDRLGGLVGGLGDVLGGELSIKDGAKGLIKGGFGGLKDIKNTAFKGLGKVKNIFKDGGLKDMKAIIKTKRTRIKPTGDPGTDIVVASNNMSDNVDSVSQTLQIASTSMASTMDNSVEKFSNKIDTFIEKVDDIIEVTNFKVLDENGKEEGGVGDEIIAEIAGESIGGNALSLLGGGSGGSGKGGILSKLLGKGKGLLGKGKGLLGKAGGMASKALGVVKGGGLLSGLGGLASGAGGALSGVAGAAAPLLAGLAPVLGPALAVGAGAFGVSKLVKGWKKKREAKKAEKAEREAALRDSNGNYKTDEEGYYDSENKGFFGRLFNRRPSVKKLDKLNKQPVPVKLVTGDGDTSSNTVSEKKNGLLNGIDPVTGEYNPAIAAMTSGKGTAKLNTETTGGKMMEALDAGMNSAMNTTPFGMITKGFKNTFLKPAYAGEKQPLSTGTGPDSAETMDGMASSDPNERTATYIKPWGEYVMSPTFGFIFGANGLFGSMFKGAKKAAGGGSTSALTGFFKKFWENSSNPSGGTAGNGGTADLDASNYGAFGGYKGFGIQSLAAKYETGDENGGDPGKIGNTAGDPGGKSYGVVQFAKNTGSLKGFVDSLQSSSPDLYSRLSKHSLASSSFDAEWKAIASEDPDGFRKLQVDRTIDTLYASFKKDMAEYVDFDNISTATESALFSTAVQHGNGRNSMLKKSLNKGMTEEQIINAIYDERTRHAKSGNHKMSASVAASVVKRYEKERKDALQILEEDKARQTSGGQYGYGGSYNQTIGGGTANLQSPNAKIQTVLDTAKSVVDSGIPYIYGGNNPNTGLDCSAFTKYAYSKAGITLPRTSGEQAKSGTAVSLGGNYKVGNALPGDLLCMPGHVQLYAGGEMTMEAASSKTGIVHRHVKNSSFGSKGTGIRRIIKQSGEGSDGSAVRSGGGNIPQLDGVMNKISRSIEKYNITIDPTLNNTLESMTSGSYQMDKSAFRNESKNNFILKIKDSLETICKNTGITNEILANILNKIASSGSSDMPLQLNNELAALYRGF